MDKSNFLLGVYDEFVRKITWPKWDELQFSTRMVAISIMMLSVTFYIIDEIFIWVLQKIFSVHF